MMIGELYIDPRQDTIPTKEEIIGLTLQDTGKGLEKSTTLPCSMLEKVLMALVEVDLGLGPSLLPPIIQMILVDQLVFIVMVKKEVDIGITPENFLHIIMAS